MDSAFSLIKHKLILASSAEYRQNLDEQLVCPTCCEQVFKKRLWVLSRQAHTHYFSHYFGDLESCPDRSSGEGNYENSKDKYAQLQRLEIFNKYFRENITNAFIKIAGKQTANRLASALEYAERICTNKIKSKELERLASNLISNLDEPITYSINDGLDDLEEALLPIYRHFKSQHGQSNLRFITCISLLLIFHGEQDHLEDILEKRTLKSKPNLSPLLLGNTVLLLSKSEYIDWHNSIKPILNFLNPLITKSSPKKSVRVSELTTPKKDSSGYFACIHCKKIHYLDLYKYEECNACHRWFVAVPENMVKKPKDLDRDDVDLSKANSTKENVITNAHWFYCISCSKQYFSEHQTSCPH